MRSQTEQHPTLKQSKKAMQEELLRKQFDTLVKLTDDEYDLIKLYFSKKQFTKKQFVFIENDYIKYCYYVVSGLMKLVYVDDSGKECIFSITHEDWWESDFMAYFTRSQTKMSLQCVENTELLCLSLDNYNKLCSEFPKMQSFFHQKSTLGFIKTQQRLLCTLTTNAKQRYEMMQKFYPSLFQRASKSLLASYLGVSRETLSRFAKK
jgi:CRP-like cAMP-binding protein